MPFNREGQNHCWTILPTRVHWQHGTVIHVFQHMSDWLQSLLHHESLVEKNFLCFVHSNRKWMGYSKRKYRSVFTFAQTAYLLENGLEITVVYGLLSSDLMRTFAFLLLTFGIINLFARCCIFVPRFLVYLAEGVFRWFRACCEQTALNYGDNDTSLRTEREPLNPGQA